MSDQRDPSAPINCSGTRKAPCHLDYGWLSSSCRSLTIIILLLLTAERVAIWKKLPRAYRRKGAQHFPIFAASSFWQSVVVTPAGPH